MNLNYLLMVVAVIFTASCATKEKTKLPYGVIPKGAPVTPEEYFEHHSDIAWEEVGRSVQDRMIAKTVYGDGDDVTLFISCFHGSESSTPRFGFDFADYMEKNQDLIADGKKVVIIPMLNPDGFAANTRRNANNVDLNRNYPTSNWGEQPQNQRRNRKVYFGPSAASEPETNIVLDLMHQYEPDKIISVHQPLHCNNPDGPAGLGLAKLMGEFNGYELKEYIGFPTPGSYGTYGGKELKIPMVTLELPPGEPWEKEYDKMWKENRDALMAVVNCNLDEL